MKDGGGIDNEPLPLENLPYDPQTMGDPPAAHPRGSAPEAPLPVHPVEGEETPPAQEDQAGGASALKETPRARRERRRLRIPKLPPVLGDPAEDEDQGGSDAEISYARTHDPQEVSFDEFFGTDDDPVEAVDEHPVEAADEGPGEAADDDGVELGRDDGGVDDGQDEPVAEDEQPDAADPTDGRPDVADAVEAPEAPEHGDDTGEDASREQVGGEEDGPAGPPGSGRRKGRTSVPSWDDIMFGGGDRRRG